MVLEWDQARNQLNFSKTAYLNKLKSELEELEAQQTDIGKPELIEKEV